MTKVEYI